MAIKLPHKIRKIAPRKSPTSPHTRPPSSASGTGGVATKAYYTTAELAARWGVSVRHVRRVLDGGEVTVTRFGRAVRVSYANLLVYEAGRTSGSP